MKNFAKINNKFLRGGQPSLKDLLTLKKDHQVNQIISLDQKIGNSINPFCNQLDIKHIILPFTFSNWQSLAQMFNPKLFELLNDHTTFVHCYHGRDRTGLFCALYRCFKNQWSGLEAILEAYQFGFGGSCHPDYIKQLSDVVCKIFSQPLDNTDEQQLQDTIVSNIRDVDMNLGLNRLEPLSWSPFEDYRVREFPYTDTYKYFSEQYPSRDDLGFAPQEQVPKITDNTIPQIGQYDTNTQGINGFGPSYVGNGTII